MDLAKFRSLFLEEATEHLGEMSRSLLALEKDPASAESIEAVFRATHSIKSMAASLDYTGISGLAHRLEDRMALARDAGRVEGADDLPLLFRGLELLERLIAGVRETGEPPTESDDELLRALSAPAEGGAARPGPVRQKKVPGGRAAPV